MKLPTCWLPNLSSTSFHLGKDSRVAHGSSTMGSHRSTPVSANFLTLCNLDFSLPLVMWWTAKWLSASKTESVSGLVHPDEFQEVAWRGPSGKALASIFSSFSSLCLQSGLPRVCWFEQWWQEDIQVVTSSWTSSKHTASSATGFHNSHWERKESVVLPVCASLCRIFWFLTWIIQ